MARWATLLEMATTSDQEPVQAPAADRLDGTLGVGVRDRRTHRRANDPHALARQHGVERRGVLPVAVADQKPRLAECADHRGVPGLLGDRRTGPVRSHPSDR